MRNHPSRSLDDICTESRICAQLSTNPSMDITHFWREVESAALPLMTKSSSNTENREVTFLWRSEEVLQGVYLRLNRVTDKRDVKKGLMTHIPSTNIWTLTLELPASYRGSYSFIEIPPEMPQEDISQLGGQLLTVTRPT